MSLPTKPSNDSAPRRADCILCVPTRLELDRLRAIDAGAADPKAWRAVEVLGFGPVAAAAMGATLAAKHPGAGFVLAGIAGRYRDDGRSAPEAPGLGEAAFFGTVSLDGVGAGEGPGLLLPSAMGFAQLEDPAGPVHETLPLDLPLGLQRDAFSSGARSSALPTAPALLTVCASSASPAMARARRVRFPSAVAEDMEAFGLALAARLGGVQLWVVRGISNEAGDRDTSTWRIDDALAAAGQLLRALP